MKYEVKIDAFEGPLDLLLHFIKKDNVDIFDISIEKITKQYLDYIEAMDQMNLDIASEYLVMAAELIEMKSAVLLPKPVINLEEEIENPREQLIQRLLEYKQYKEITESFKQLEENRKQIYTKIPENLHNYQSETLIPVGEGDLQLLLNAFEKFLNRKEEEQPLHTTVTTKEYSVKQRSNEIRTLLKERKQIQFSELFEIPQKDYIIVTFLSILTLAKRQELKLEQDHNFDDIVVSLREES